MKTFNIIGILTILGLLAFGHVMKIKQDQITNKAIKILIEDNRRTNKRVTELNRKFYNDYAMISKEDVCKVVKTHMLKNHTSYGKGCLK